LDVEIFFKTIDVLFRGEEKFVRHVSEYNMEKMISDYNSKKDNKF